MSETNNPLLQESQLSHNAIVFNEINNQHYLPAIKKGIELAKADIQAIINNAETPNFKNTIEALECSGETLSSATSVFYNLLSAHRNDEMQNIANEAGPLLSAHGNETMLSADLFKKVKHVFDNQSSEDINLEQIKLLTDTYKSFTKNGANLNPEDKEKLKKIDQELSLLSPKFSENALKATKSFCLEITNESDLDGLPESAKEAAKALAKEKSSEKDKDVWAVTLDAPSFMPFMKYATNRGLRQKIWTAFTTRATSGEHNNQETILKTITLKKQRANLLGFKTHADYVLQDRMAETPAKVHSFLEDLYTHSFTAAKKDVAEVEAYAKELDSLDKLMPWDFSFYSEKLKKKLFSFNEEELRPYFKLENVVDGVFAHAQKLYGIDFKKVTNYPTYHEDVQTFEIYNKSDNSFIGLLYADFFPRDSKSGGAWMTNYKDQGLFNGKVRRPHVGIVCNFTKPTETSPSLLTYNEVRTLFHEFGHALHGLLANGHYRSLSGTNVYWDFVELPSQIFENWTLEKEGLNLFAKHYQTGEVIPDDLITKLKKNSKFLAGYACIRQLNFCFLDMAWHNNENPEAITDVLAFEKEATKRTQLFEPIDGTCSSCAFGHIFAGGYSAGYYSYKWAEVLDADAFEYFQEKGIFNESVATSFKENILERGGSEHPMTLYKKFRGREPDPKALLRRDGLI